MTTSAAHIAALRREGELLAGAAEDALDRAVPTCPGWDMAALVGHTGGVHRRVANLVTSGGGPPSGPRDQSYPNDAGELLAWYREGLDTLVDALAGCDPNAECWTWAGPRRWSWWCRRMSEETVVHRVDAQIARFGAPVEPIDPAVALDGVEEYLEEFLTGRLRDGEIERPPGTLHLHATDGGEAGGEWWLDFGDSELGLRREHSKADTAVRGSAADLLLWLWNRRTPAEAGLEVFGSTDVLDALRRLAI
ncbi:MAG: maleylpyruvate isomerase family mycothiol-dependent enzyme [Acidimicrobiales bacterium]